MARQSNDLQPQRQQAADKALADYLFGLDLMVTDTGNWTSDATDRNRLSCRLYAEDNEAQAMPLVFCVDFADSEAQPVGAVAFDLSSGSEIGTAG